VVNQIQQIPIKQLTLSTTAAQKARRSAFDKTALEELANSIKLQGLLQPILARPLEAGRFEIIAGERRFLAAQKAGLDAIDVSVRELSDDKVLELQLVENLQREGLGELAEAEGYEQLMKQHRFTIDDVMNRVAKSRAYVYARLKLLALCPEARDSLRSGEISASIALLLARIPNAKLQKDALRQVLRGQFREDGPMSYRQALAYVHREFMLRLAEAPFDPADATLVRNAGACGTCPKRTGNQPELFGDVKHADVCTDPPCFNAKREAAVARQIEAFKDKGQKVIVGAAAKKILPFEYSDRPQGGEYRSLDEYVATAQGSKKLRAVIGKSVPQVVIQHPATGKLILAAKTADVKTALKAAGVSSRLDDAADPEVAKYRAKQRREKAKHKLEAAYRAALYQRVRERLPAKIEHEDLLEVVTTFFNRLEHDVQKKVVALQGFEIQKRKLYGSHYAQDLEKTAAKAVNSMQPHELARFVFDCVYACELQVYRYSSEPPARLLRAAQRVCVDAQAVRREVEAQQKAKQPKARGTQKRARKSAT
jgi:ParB/RepB/Spo0J family partition protein